MEMKSMALTDADRKEQEKSMCSPCDPSTQKYPWGLEVRLENSVLEKLGLGILPGVGEKLMLHASVEVTYVSQNESKDGGKNQNLGLQITAMSLEKDNSKPVAEKLYGGSGS